MDSSRADSYLGSNAIRAMSSSLSLAATVLRFQIVELWHENQEGEYCCTYVHAVEDIMKCYKDIIVGYYPEHTREHMISPRLCELSKVSSTRCHWRSVEINDNNECLYKIAGFPVLTEMGYVVEGRSDGPNVFIVGFASEIVEKKQSKMKFLFGLGYAISVAAFDFEEDDDEYDDDVAGNELDLKKFVPARPLVATPFVSGLNLATAALPLPNLMSTGDIRLGGIWGQNLSEANLQALHSAICSPRSEVASANDISEGIGLDLSDSPSNVAVQTFSPEPFSDLHGSVSISTNRVELMKDLLSLPRSSPSVHNVKPIQAPKVPVPTLNLSSIPRPVRTLSSSDSQFLPIYDVGIALPTPSEIPVQREVCDSGRMFSARSYSALPLSARYDVAALSSRTIDTSRHSVASTILTSIPPTWDPAAPFSFAVAAIPAKHILPDDLTIDSFSDVSHIADGSNANIFTARYNGKRVIIKMIKASAQTDSVSVHEFDVEHGLLCRISHPNIIKILGAGILPRRFIVLEHLGGGTLNNILSENVSKSGLASRLFRKPSFTYNNLLIKARDMADALDYIHRRFHPGACIIHRDLKPDNVGFSSDGIVKLFDFGLATCVKARSSSLESYEMTGMTGSLRYMAPETALRKPYTEKVDVYSFGILVWQMARDRVPFKGFNKDEFLKNVSLEGERPKLDSSWPSSFSNLLTRCWHQDPLQRPSFASIVEELDRMIHGDTVSPVKSRPLRGAIIKSSTENASSMWF